MVNKIEEDILKSLSVDKIEFLIKLCEYEKRIKKSNPKKFKEIQEAKKNLEFIIEIIDNIETTENANNFLKALNNLVFSDIRFNLAFMKEIGLVYKERYR